MILGAIMILALLLICYADDALERIDIHGTAWQWLGVKSVHADRPHLGGLVLLGFLVVLIILATREICALVRAKGGRADPRLVGLSGISGCSLMYFLPADLDARLTMAIFATLACVLLLICLICDAWRGRIDGALQRAAMAMFALVYMGFMPGFLIAIRHFHSAWVVAAILLVTKSCDIGAYFVGRAIGRHKLIPWLSPGKTWEGLVGGVALSTLVCLVLVSLANQAQYSLRIETGHETSLTSLWFAALAGACLAVVGQIGDLVASCLKRDAQVKDSGNCIPGFGGILDVVDSPTMVAPVAFWLLQILE